MSGIIDNLTVENNLTAQVVQTASGVNLESHAARHAPGGADAINLEANSASTETNQVTSSGFATGLTLNANGLLGGNYKIEWYYEWGFNDVGNDFLGRVQVDDVTTIMDHREAPADSGGIGPGGTDQRAPQSGFAIVALTPGNHFIDLDFGSGSGVQATLWRARLLLRRWG